MWVRVSVAAVRYEVRRAHSARCSSGLTLCSVVFVVVGAVTAARGLQLEREAEELQQQMRALLTESQVGVCVRG